MNWWLIIRTPDGVHAWPVWEEHGESDETLINAARVSAGFPAHDQWGNDGFDIQLTLGDPHPTLLERATVGTVEDLRQVAAVAVTAHADARAAAIRQTQIDAARTAYALLDDPGKAEVRGG